MTNRVIEFGGEGLANIKHGFARSCERSGLVGVTPHVLRHTCVSWLVQSGVSVKDTADYTGMTEDMVRRIYAHLHPDFGQQQVAALNKIRRRDRTGLLTETA